MPIINGTDEALLVEQVRQGDRSAFGELFNYYYAGLVIYAVQLTTSYAQSEEIVQDFFVRLWEKHDVLRPGDSLKNYFFTSVRNSCFNWLKHKKVKSGYLEELKQLSSEHFLYDPDLYVASELQSKIMEAIGKLPDRCREIFVMSRLRGMKNEEIANELNISKRTVETQITNALKVLRVELKDYVGLLFLLGLGNFH